MRTVFTPRSRHGTRDLEIKDARDSEHDTGTAAPLSSAPLDAAAAKRVRTSFARQGAMATFGAELAEVAAGCVMIALPIAPRLSQQDGFLHAGVVVAALDSACGYAALTLMPDDAEVLTVELKVNLLAPASGDKARRRGRGRPRRSHADRLPRRRVRRAGGRAHARRDDAGDDGASAPGA